MTHHEHHFRNLSRARDHLTETILSLESAVDVMTGNDWIEATAILRDISLDIGPRLARLRTAASERFDEYSRLQDFEAMRTGVVPFPDERAIHVAAASPAPPKATTAAPPPPPLVAPNAKVGAQLVAKHGGIDQALMAYEPDSAEYDHIQAYRYIATGKRPKRWIPPIA